MGRLQKEGMRLEIALSQFLLKYRVTPHPATDQSPAEILLNRKLRTLLDLVKPTAVKEQKSDKMPNNSYLERMKRNFDKGTNSKKKFDINQKVFARNYRGGAKWFPGQITRKIGSTMFLVRTARGVWKRHYDQLKENLTDQGWGDSDSESEDDPPTDQEENVDPPPPPKQPPPIQPPAADGLLRSTRVRKTKTICDPSA